MKRTISLAAAAALALASIAVLAPAASAKDQQTRMRGDCSAASDWVLRVRDKKGQLRTDFWVKNNAAAGQPWTLTVSRGGTTLATSAKQTRASDDAGGDDSPHVSEVKWRTWVAPGSGALEFTATGPGGETCSATAGG